MERTAPVLCLLYTAILVFHFQEVPMHSSRVDRQSAMRMHSRGILSVTTEMRQSIWGAAGSSMHRHRRVVSVMEMQPIVRSQRCGVCCNFDDKKAAIDIENNYELYGNYAIINKDY